MDRVLNIRMLQVGGTMMGVGAIVVICSACFGGIVSLTTIIHQIMNYRNLQLNAAIQKKALEQQQSSLALMRKELKQINTAATDTIYQDNKQALALIESKLDQVYQQKSLLIEQYLQQLKSFMSRWACITKKEQTLCQKTLGGLKEELKEQLQTCDRRLAHLQKEQQQLLDNHFQLAKVVQQKELIYAAQYSQLYGAHSQTLERLQNNFAKQHLSLTERVIDSSKTFIENSIVAPARFMSSYFSTAAHKEIKSRTDKEKKQRERILAMEHHLNASSAELSQDFESLATIPKKLGKTRF